MIFELLIFSTMNLKKDNYILTNTSEKIFYNVDILKEINRNRQYTTKQKSFHNQIDYICTILSRPLSTSPQIARGNAIDVEKYIIKLGRFVNPANKNFVFADTYIDTTDTLNKLNLLKERFSNYCLSIFKTIPYKSNIEEEDSLLSLNFLIKEIIRTVEKEVI